MKKIIILTIFSMLLFDNINAQSYYKKDGKFGALTKDGAILTEAKYDTVYMPRFAYRDEYLITKYSNKYGIIIFSTDTTPIIIQPKFDFIYYQDICDIVILQQGNKYGFIDYKEKYEAGSPALLYWIKNVYISDIKYDSIIGHYLYDGNKVGFLFKGYMTFGDRLVVRTYSVIPAIYDTITSYIGYDKFEKLIEDKKSINSINYPIIKVVKDGFVNYLTVSYKGGIAFHPLFPDNTYTTDEINYIEDTREFIINKIGKPLQIFQPTDSTFKKIIDETGKTIILNKYYLFRYKEKSNVYPNGHNVHFYIGVNDKEMINIFVDAKNKYNSVVYKDTIFDDSALDKVIDYNNITIVKVITNDLNGSSDIDYIPYTIFMAKHTRYKTESGYKTEVTLLSYPENKVIYNITLNNENEQLIFNKEEYYYEESCPYIKLYLEIKKNSKSKYKMLGYINYKTHEFMKNKPKDAGCKTQPLGWD
jgi:hypothetical protein